MQMSIWKIYEFVDFDVFTWCGCTKKMNIGKLNALCLNFINILFQVENKNLFSKSLKI